MATADIEDERPRSASPARKKARGAQKGFSALELNKWFAHTSFGCMGHPLVAHFEPSTTCAHDCSYCYAKCYVGAAKRRPSEAMLGHTPEDIVLATRAEGARLIKHANKIFGTEKDDGMPPEMHFSISTDALQPSREVQETSFIVMREWLGMGLLVSIVTKGVPYSDEFAERLLALFHANPDRVSYQQTCASMNPAKQMCVERGAPPPTKRIAFLGKVVAAGVVRASLRINPLIPGFNDSDAEIEATLQSAASVGVKRAAISYAYGSAKIFRGIERDSRMNIRQFYESDKFDLQGGTGKYHVLASQRQAKTAFAKECGARLGIVVSACGCDNVDIFPKEKCGICFRSRVKEEDKI